jgi:hypothetical protein
VVEQSILDDLERQQPSRNAKINNEESKVINFRGCGLRHFWWIGFTMPRRRPLMTIKMALRQLAPMLWMQSVWRRPDQDGLRETDSCDLCRPAAVTGRETYG